MKRWIMCVCVLAVALLTAGCGSSSFEPSVTSIYIKKDGTLTQAIVESFEKAYYSEDEFSSMVESEIAAFNKNHGEELISMESLEVRDDTMYLLLDYTNADAYAQYNDTFCYVGTIGSALELPRCRLCGAGYCQRDFGSGSVDCDFEGRGDCSAGTACKVRQQQCGDSFRPYASGNDH